MKLLLMIMIAGALCAQAPPAPAPDSAAPAAAAPSAQRETIVVTGSYEPIPLEEADRAVSQTPVRGQTLLYQNVIDALLLDPSVDLQQRAPDGTQADLSIRGSTFGQTLILVNGMRVNDVQTAHHDLNLTVPLDEVQSVEILRGAGSSLYGSDALGGVVNIVTAPPGQDEFRFRSALGNEGINEESASLAGVLRDLSEQLTFSRDFSSGFQFDRDYRDFTLGSATFYKWQPRTTAIDLGFADRAFGADQFYGDYPSWERTKTWFSDIRQSLGESTEADFAYR